MAMLVVHDMGVPHFHVHGGRCSGSCALAVDIAEREGNGEGGGADMVSGVLGTPAQVCSPDMGGQWAGELAVGGVLTCVLPALSLWVLGRRLCRFRGSAGISCSRSSSAHVCWPSTLGGVLVSAQTWGAVVACVRVCRGCPGQRFGRFHGFWRLFGSAGH